MQSTISDRVMSKFEHMSEADGDTSEKESQPTKRSLQFSAVLAAAYRKHVPESIQTFVPIVIIAIVITILSVFVPQSVIADVIGWAILVAASLLAYQQILEIVDDSSEDEHRRRANFIGIVIGLVVWLFLFRDNFITDAVKIHTAGQWPTWIFAGGAAAGGWSIWYLRKLSKHGEFFNITLQTALIGVAWYSRLAPSEPIRTAAVAFLVFSLVRIAFDYLEQSSKFKDSGADVAFDNTTKEMSPFSSSRSDNNQ